MENIIVDAHFILTDVLLQRQEMAAPKEILDRQRLVEVTYISFDEKIHSGQIVVDVDLAADVEEVFALMLRLKFPVQSVIPLVDRRFMSDDEKSVMLNNSSGFNYRFIAKTTKLSNHASGRAIDINPALNPYIRDDYRMPPNGKYDPNAAGAIIAGGPIVSYFYSKGWQWGGDWTDRKDYMHFEKPL